MAVKRVSLFWGSFSQRAIEYPWLLDQLKLLKSRAIVLDVGCAESLLSHELTARKFKVIGVDIRDYPFKSKRMNFVKGNVTNAGFRSDVFDAIIIVSTIEHIGLNAYGQVNLDEEGDVKAASELYRILRPGGVVIVTTPYIGNEPFRLEPGERNYNRERLTRLVSDFRTSKEDYFYPEREISGRRLSWVKMDRESIDKESFSEPGLACIVLQKPNSTDIPHNL